MRNILPILIITLLTLVGFVIAEEATGPTPAGGQVNSKHGPVQMGAYAQPSALPSPVAAGKVDRLTTDGEGNLWARLRSGNVSVVGISDSGGTTLSDSIGLIVQGTRDHDSAVTSTHNPFVGGAIAYDTLPAGVSTDADVCRVSSTKQGQLRVILDANANAVGISNYCAPSHAGGGTEVTVKASAGLVKYLHVSNPNTTDVYLHLWDASNPTPGTTDPLVCYTVPGGTGASNRGVYDLVLPEPGITCATAITATVTTAANGSSAPASAVTLNIGYK